jgi:hypothetical protein
MEVLGGVRGRGFHERYYILRKAGPFCSSSSSVRLWWEFEKLKDQKVRAPDELIRGETFSCRIWQRKLPHECFNITSKTVLCNYFRCLILKVKYISLGENTPPPLFFRSLRGGARVWPAQCSKRIEPPSATPGGLRTGTWYVRMPTPSVLP